MVEEVVVEEVAEGVEVVVMEVQKIVFHPKIIEAERREERKVEYLVRVCDHAHALVVMYLLNVCNHAQTLVVIVD